MKKYSLTYKVTFEFDAIDDVAAREKAKGLAAEDVTCTGSLESVMLVHSTLDGTRVKATLRDRDRVVRL